MGPIVVETAARWRDYAPLVEALEPGVPGPEALARRVLLDPNFEPGGALVVRRGGEAVGGAVAIARRVPLENAPPDAERGYVTLLAVDPRHRRQGIGGALVEAAEAYLAVRGCTSVWVSPYAPGYFVPGVDVEAHAEALRLLARHGYGEVYRPLAMRTSLPALASPSWVDDRERALAPEYGVRTFSPDLAFPLLEFVQRVFPGDWVRVVRETGARILQGEPPTRLFVAVRADGRVVGFSHHEADRFGPIGTDPEVRGLGLGQVLMFRTLHAQRAEGHAEAYFLWSDDRTARRLYDAARFREWRRFAVLKKSISPRPSLV
ncbi:MAG: GNAT family N-acetyltransferase [Fimbriimonadaceae bacterium]|nr:GNAT family N-acetyltransferase [Chthonomonadaceae bacterium]MCO5297127.1 GNAT family N-acetyltransferase [Fimbriimonadaceae bacterium]